MQDQEVSRIVHALGGKMHSPNSGTCFCPVHHNTRTPALSVSRGQNGKLLVKCFTGCDPISILQELRNMGLTDPYNNLSYSSRSYTDPVADFKALPPLSVASHVPVVNNRSKAEYIQKIQSECLPASDTLVMSYLRSRAIDIIPSGYVMFHPKLYHSPTKQLYPAMVSFVTRFMSNDVTALHRTFLTPSGQKAKIPQNKMMFGNCNGGGVTLAFGNDGVLVVSEGIETALSLAEMYPNASVVACLSSAGIKNFILPEQYIGKLVIGVDGDKAGIKAAYKLAERAKCKGWDVFLKKAPQGKDWNDILRERKNHE